MSIKEGMLVVRHPNHVKDDWWVRFCRSNKIKTTDSVKVQKVCKGGLILEGLSGQPMSDAFVPFISLEGKKLDDYM